jgi:phosphatidylglycerol:prolipoprotein diacylglycerol transferase
MFALFPTRAIALILGPFSIHWYGIMYVLAFLIAAVLAPRIARMRGLDLSSEEWSSVLGSAVLGVLVGGRLGFVFLYEPAFFWQHPFEIVAVWHGGMASHGGFVGVLIALVWAARKYKIPLLTLADVAVVPVAIGLMLGRIGNFINLELYGTVTTMPWGITIPDVEGLRHPTQLYAAAKDLLIAVACWLHLRHVHPVIAGRTAALFLFLYGVLRFVVEFFREQPYGYIALPGFSLSWGQLWTIPIILVGLGLWSWMGQGLVARRSLRSRRGLRAWSRS